MDIILYLLNYINYQRKIIGQLLNFICRYIPLKQWAFDDSHSPKYQKFKIDELPKILHYESWDYRLLLPYLEWKYGKKIKPVHRRSDCNIPDDCSWVTYYNFLRPHRHNGYRVLNHVQELDNADNMPGKWQLLIYLGQCRIKQMQQGEAHNCS